MMKLALLRSRLGGGLWLQLEPPWELLRRLSNTMQLLLPAFLYTCEGASRKWLKHRQPTCSGNIGSSPYDQYVVSLKCQPSSHPNLPRKGVAYLPYTTRLSSRLEQEDVQYFRSVVFFYPRGFSQGAPTFPSPQRPTPDLNHYSSLI